jgi:glycolate oxidase iron-sulfur subunit
MADTLQQLQEELQQCIHCGLCLPACPTYDLTRRERSSPRGRISLMKAVAAGELEPGAIFAQEMGDCLGCLACQTACPAGVDYASLIETARAEVETRGLNDSSSRSFWRWFALEQLFMNPRALRLAGRVLRIYQKCGLDLAARRFGLNRILPKSLRDLEPQTPRIAAGFSNELIDEHESPVSPPKHRVALLTGCVQDLVFSDINRDTADVLLANGCEVHTPPLQPCCGSLHAHNGAPELARELARRLIDLLPPDRFNAIITNSGGCGSHLRHYGKLLAGDPAYATRALLWDSKLRDIHEWLIETGCRPPLAAPQDTPLTVTYHDSCHLAHGQKVVRQPRELLDQIPAVTTVSLPEASWCCGSAGIYNITRPETSAALMERKVGHVIATGASHLATANPGCHLQLARGLADAGSPVEMIQPVTLLARAYRRESLT